jgi:hypothetical protein
MGWLWMRHYVDGISGDRTIMETVLSMLTTVCHLKRLARRAWDDFKARLAFTMVAFNILV